MGKLFYFNIIFLLSILYYSSSVYSNDISYDSNSNDIRNVKWLSSKEEVINKENLTEPFIDMNGFIIKDGIVLDNKCSIAYHFKDNKLDALIYEFTEFNTDNKEKECKRLFNVFKEELSEKYKFKKRDINDLNKISEKKSLKDDEYKLIELFKDMAGTLDERNPRFENDRTTIEIQDDCGYKNGSKLKILYAKIN